MVAACLELHIHAEAEGGTLCSAPTHLPVAGTAGEATNVGCRDLGLLKANL